MVDGEVGLTLGPAAPPVVVANKGGKGSAIIQPQLMEEMPAREPRSPSKTATMSHVLTLPDGILIHLDGVHLDGIETHLDGILIHLDTTVTHLDGTQIHLVGIQVHLDGIKFGIQTHLAGDQSRMELPKKQLYTFIMLVV